MAEDPKQIHFCMIWCPQGTRKLCKAISLVPTTTLYAIYCNHSVSAKEAKKEYDGQQVKIYRNYNEVLDDPCVDAVYIPSQLPNSDVDEWATLAASKKKHLLLEKPSALETIQLDGIIDACEMNGIQFMDGTSWYHNPRTQKIKEIISDPHLFGRLNLIRSTSTYLADQYSSENTSKLGALGDLGWYCIGTILWAMDYKLPTFANALPEITYNSKSTILSCNASLHWENKENNKQSVQAIFHCSFLSNISMDVALYGSNGSIHVTDFAVPCKETSSAFEFTTGAKFAELHIGWNVRPQKIEVQSQLPQESLMVQEFAKLVRNIKRSDQVSLDKKWGEISKKTRVVMSAVQKSIELGFKPVYV